MTKFRRARELPEPERYVVCGSRDWPLDGLWLVTAMMIEIIPEGSIVITGGAEGVDEHAHREAVRLDYRTLVMPAEWRRNGQYNRRAGLERNLRMLDEDPVAVLAFQYRRSRGTGHTIREASRRGIKLHWFTERDLQPDIAALDMGDAE